MSLGSRVAAFVNQALIALRLRKAPAAVLPKRNDPCPCGSGKKFKACHLNQVLAEARVNRGARINEANAVTGRGAMAERGREGRTEGPGNKKPPATF